MPNQSTIDAIIFNEREVNSLIWAIRKGKIGARNLRDYREHVQALSALLEAADQQEKSEAKAAGRAPKVIEWKEPYPNGQIVGVPDQVEKMKLGWRGWFKSLERNSVSAPSHYSIAAE